MVILNQNVTIHTLAGQFVYLSKEFNKKASEFSSRLELWWLVQNSTVMTVAAILRSRLLKMAAKRKLNISLQLS